jgi:hypothetical protein
MRPIAAPFVVAPPSGARIRTRLRVDADDERVLWRSARSLAGSPAWTWRRAAVAAQATTSAPAASAL